MQEAPKTVDVTHHDQQNINTFGRLNNKSHQLESTIKDRKVRPQATFRSDFRGFHSK